MVNKKQKAYDRARLLFLTSFLIMFGYFIFGLYITDVYPGTRLPIEPFIFSGIIFVISIILYKIADDT